MIALQLKSREFFIARASECIVWRSWRPRKKDLSMYCYRFGLLICFPYLLSKFILLFQIIELERKACHALTSIFYYFLRIEPTRFPKTNTIFLILYLSRFYDYKCFMTLTCIALLNPLDISWEMSSWNVRVFSNAPLNTSNDTAVKITDSRGDWHHVWGRLKITMQTLWSSPKQTL